MSRAAERREAVLVMRRRGISQRRACILVHISDSSLRYRSRPRDNQDLLAQLQTIARQHPRYGYRRAWAIVRRAGQRVNHKRVARLWRQAGLAVPRRVHRRRRVGTASRPLHALHPNHVWTYDFLYDRCANGRTIKVLTVVDEFTREGLAIKVAQSIPAPAVQQVLQHLFATRGRPHFLRSDNGPEFLATALRQWLMREGAATLYIEPGRPWQNGLGESFNGKLRDECLNTGWFWTVLDAQVQIEQWRRCYNTERPHSSLDYQTPAEFAAQWYANQSRENLTP